MHDVIVAGAGPGGSAAAYFLAQHGLNVLLLDKSEFPRDKTCGDGLSHHALRALDDMGILGDVVQVGHPVRGVEVYSPRGYSANADVPATEGPPDYGLVVPRLKLDAMLLERAIVAGARYHSLVHVTDVERNGKGVTVRGEHRGQPYSAAARVVIIAIGVNPTLLLRIGLLKKAPPMIRAARTYFEGVTGLTDRIVFRFQNVPLPGYGWVFPVSGSIANIGVYQGPPAIPARYMPVTPQAALEAFTRLPELQEMLAHAQPTGPAKGYPLRSDWRGPAFADRVLLVGEAAGLVNPLTGEGIDCALESGQMAAQHLIHVWSEDGLPLEGYDQLVRQRFYRLFYACKLIRDVFVNDRLFDQLVRAADRHPDLKTLLLSVVLGTRDASEMLSLKIMQRLALALRTFPIGGSPVI